MEQIEKLQLKRKTSKEEYAIALQEFENAYSNATAELKEIADNYLLSARSESSANPRNNRSQRERDTLVYKNAIALMNGTYSKPLSPSISRPNIFLGYSKLENINDANTIANLYLEVNNKRNSINVPITTNTSQYKDTEFSWDIDKIFGTDSDTLADRITRISDALITKINNILTARDAGDNIRGVTPEELNNFATYKSKLQAISSLASSDPTTAFRKLLDIAPNIGFTESSFKTYFGDLIPGSSTKEKAKLAAIKEGYNEVDLSNVSNYVKNIINQKQWNIMSKDGRNYVFDKDYNLVPGSTTLNLINLKQGDDYGQAVLVNGDNEIYFGNAATDIQEGHNFYEQFLNYKNELFLKYNNLFVHKTFDNQNDYSENELVNRFVTSKVLNNINKDKVNYTDVSGLFTGNDNVIAYNTDGSPITEGDYGELKLGPNTKFAYIDRNGVLKYNGTISTIKRDLGIDFKAEGDGTTAEAWTGDLTNLSGMFDNAQGYSGNTQILKYNWKEFLTAAGLGAASGAMVGSAAGGITAVPAALIGALAAGLIDHNLFLNSPASGTIGQNKKWFVNTMLEALDNPQGLITINDKQYYALDVLDNFDLEKLLLTLGLIVESKEFKLDEKHQKLYNKLVKINYYKNYNLNFQGKMHKEGGIISAASGALLSVLNPEEKTNYHDLIANKNLNNYTKLRQEAFNKNYKTVKGLEADLSTDLTSSDYLRMATIALDTLSIIASFVPGGGTGIAAGLGATSMFTDLAADFQDDAISSTQMLTNLGVNAGFAVAGVVPGLKTTRVVKNIIKYAPKVMTAISGTALAADPEILATFKKLGKEELTHKDWRNLARVFLTVASGVKTGKQSYDMYKIKKGIITKDNVVIKNIKTPNGAEFELPKETVTNLNDLLKNAENLEAAKTILKNAKNENGVAIFTDDQIGSIIKTNGWGKSHLPGKGKFELTTGDKKKSVDETASYEHLRQLWNQEQQILDSKSGFLNGKYSQWFANKFGGGSYTGKLRAILDLDPKFAEKVNVPDTLHLINLRRKRNDSLAPEQNVATTPKITSDIIISKKPTIVMTTNTNLSTIENGYTLNATELARLKSANLISNMAQGAVYDQTKNQLIIWKQGGLINNKYHYLRK